MINTILLNDFYTVSSSEVMDDSKLIYSINLNTNHSIFKGHFEQMPIVPGVCQTQIIKEILQEHLGINLQLIKGDNIKFLAMIIPTQNEQITVEIIFKKEIESYVVDAKLYSETTIFTKFKGVLITN